MKPCRNCLLRIFICLMVGWSSWLMGVSLADYHVTDQWSQGDCELFILETYDGHKALLKMVCDPDIDEQSLLVMDYLGCHIAASCDLPINRVRLVLPQDNPHGGLATLHEWASGLSVEDQPPWDEFDLHQRYRYPDSPYYKKYGPLPQERQGLTRSVLKTMAQHPHLAQIAALDTFLGNADRSRPNVYYDLEHNCFVGIDLAASFRSPLAEAAIRQISKMKELGFSLSELAALRVYQQTLDSLTALVSVKDVESWCQDIALIARLEDSERLAATGKRWQGNYALTCELSIMLRELLAHEPIPPETQKF